MTAILPEKDKALRLFHTKTIRAKYSFEYKLVLVKITLKGEIYEGHYISQDKKKKNICFKLY